jgi:hypothetical protein
MVVWDYGILSTQTPKVARREVIKYFRDLATRHELSAVQQDGIDSDFQDIEIVFSAVSQRSDRCFRTTDVLRSRIEWSLGAHTSLIMN